MTTKTLTPKQMAAKLKKFGDDYPALLGYGLYSLGLEIMRRSVRLVPVVTNRLRSSAYVSPVKPVGSTQWKVVIGYGAEYALYVHEGTRFMKGRKYLWNAIVALSQRDALEAFTAGIESRIGPDGSINVPTATSGEFQEGPDGD